MNSTTSGIAAGIVLGIVFVILAQQFGYLSLSSLTAAVEYLVIGIVVGAVIFGVIGLLLGRLYLKRHPPAPETTDSP
jgi:hypothetical protein